MLAVQFKPQLDYHNLHRVNQQHINEITKSIIEILNSGNYIKGEATKVFENKFADYIGTSYCIGVANGFDALRLIIRAYICIGKLNIGDSILVPHNASFNSVLAIIEEGLSPILTPPCLDSYAFDTLQLNDYLLSNTKAIMPVHFYGMPCYSDELKAFVNKFNLLVIEDNTQAVGASYKNQKTGSLGDAAGVSFSPDKNLGAIGEGGAVLTNDAVLADMVRLLSNGISNINSKFKYKGLNSCLGEMQAAILTVKLQYLDAHNYYRNVVAEYYKTNIKTPFIALPVISKDCNYVWSNFVIRSHYRNELRHYLQKNNVEVAIHNPIIISKQEAFPELHEYNCDRTNKLFNEILSIPIGSVMSFEEIENVVSLLNSFRP